MSRCDRCGNEVVLPFSCQYCGGRYCADCRLPPNHDCVNIVLWNSKPLPSVGISYGKGGRATPTGGSDIPGPRQAGNKKNGPAKTGNDLPYLAILLAILVLIILGIAWLAFSGYRFG